MHIKETKMKKYIIVFKSTHYAIMSEKKLKAFRIQMIPTPREITASCGLSIEFDMVDGKEILDEMKNWDNIEEMLEIYILNKETKVATKIDK